MAPAEWTKINKRTRRPATPKSARGRPSRQRGWAPRGREAGQLFVGRKATRQALAARLRGRLPLALPPLRPARSSWSQGPAASSRQPTARLALCGQPCLFNHFSRLFFKKESFSLKNPSFFRGTTIAPHSSVLSSR